MGHQVVSRDSFCVLGVVCWPFWVFLSACFDKNNAQTACEIFPSLASGTLLGETPSATGSTFSLRFAFDGRRLFWWPFLLFAGYNNAGEQFKQSAAQACLYFAMCVSLKRPVVTPRGRRRKPWHEMQPRPPAWLFKMKAYSGGGPSHGHRCQFLWPRVWPPADLVMEIKWQGKKKKKEIKGSRLMPAVFPTLREQLWGCE